MTLDINRIQALCFDVDGTLSDTDDQYVEKFAKLFRPLSFLFKNKDAHRAARRFVMWSETPGNMIFGLPDVLGLDDELASLTDWLTRKKPPKLKHFILIEGIKEMLTALSEHYPMAVVTARNEEGTMQFLEQYDLLPFFDVVVTALTAEHSKPYPDPVIYAAKEMNTPVENCLMIGDTTVDIRAGKIAGAQTVGVLCGFGEEKELRQRGADIILETTSELTAILLKGK
ncbi:MAG: HAD family hydrolase [Anaerolineae bacterium]|jgi:N-acetyl-D-muramate 6-phosphate phosphatase|nr:HAD family hydrolase [Anaerolineae bacterium]MBT7075333.1 HAD family hydrolase [Anaerolineae bacterium]MBT7781949.1 HAD family hydrolase [Anaerolineae bacterium]